MRKIKYLSLAAFLDHRMDGKKKFWSNSPIQFAGPLCLEETTMTFTSASLGFSSRCQRSDILRHWENARVNQPAHFCLTTDGCLCHTLVSSSCFLTTLFEDLFIEQTYNILVLKEQNYIKNFGLFLARTKTIGSYVHVFIDRPGLVDKIHVHLTINRSNA